MVSLRDVLSVFACLLTGALCARADTLIGYWDLNSTTAVSSGTTSATLSARIFDLGTSGTDNNDVGASFLTYGAGTSVNKLAGFADGQALAFGSFATIVGDGYIEINGLDFTEYQMPTISFAAVKDIDATLFSTFEIQYKLSGGSWQTATSLSELPTSFQTVGYTFNGHQLDGQANAGVRIHFTDIVDVASYAKFDNIQVTAIPEPATLGFGILGMAFLGGRFVLRAARRR